MNFNEKLNDSVSMVYSREIGNFKDITAEGLLHRGRYIGFDSEDFRSLKNLVYNCLKDYVGEYLVENYNYKDLETDFNSDAMGKVLFYNEDSLENYTSGIKGRVRDLVHIRNFEYDIKYYIAEYLDKGFDYLRGVAAEYAKNNINQEDFECYAKEYLSLNDIYESPEKHINEWLGKEVKDVLKNVKSVHCDDIKITKRLNVNTIYGYLSGETQDGKYVDMPFEKIDRLFYKGKCIYNKDAEIDRLESEEFKMALQSMKNAAKKQKDKGTSGDLVYDSASGHFGVIIKYGEKIYLDDRRIMAIKDDCFVFKTSLLDYNLQKMQDFILDKYLICDYDKIFEK